MQSYIFEDIIVDIDDILPDPNKEPEPEQKTQGPWDSGSKENIWRDTDPKDIWTADPINGSEKEPWDAGNPDSPEDPHDDHQEGTDAYGDIFQFTILNFNVIIITL